MPWLVDTGDNHLEEADNKEHAIHLARLALESADSFAARFGWSPFWAETVCVIQCRAAVWQEYGRDYTEVKARGRIVMNAGAIRKREGLPPALPRP